MINTSLYFLGDKIYSLYLPANIAFSQEILNSLLVVTGKETNCYSLLADLGQSHTVIADMKYFVILPQA